MAHVVTYAANNRMTAWLDWILRRIVPSSTATRSDSTEEEVMATPNQPTGIQLTGPPFVFNTAYIQTATGALNLVETCLAMVLFFSLCTHNQESLSEVLFLISFTYAIAGLYLLLNGICNQPPPPQLKPPSTLLMLQLLVYHCIGSLVFLVCGGYVLTRYYGVARAIVAGTVSVVDAGVHLSHTLYIYRGDFKRWWETV